MRSAYDELHLPTGPHATSPNSISPPPTQHSCSTHHLIQTHLTTAQLDSQLVTVSNCYHGPNITNQHHLPTTTAKRYAFPSFYSISKTHRHPQKLLSLLTAQSPVTPPNDLQRRRHRHFPCLPRKPRTGKRNHPPKHTPKRRPPSKFISKPPRFSLPSSIQPAWQ